MSAADALYQHHAIELPPLATRTLGRDFESSGILSNNASISETKTLRCPVNKTLVAALSNFWSIIRCC